MEKTIIPNNKNLQPYILITGASAGVGRQAAVTLSSRYNLVLHGRNMAKLEETDKLCSNNTNVIFWTQDFTCSDTIEDSLKNILTTSDIKISGFVHSAGMVEVLPIRSMTLEKVYRILNTNVISAYLISKVLSQKSINSLELKNIVFISSNISKRGAKGFSAYGASKGALDALMRCLAVELAPRVRVNSILPGGMKTEMTAQMCLDKELLARMESTYPLGMGTPSDIADVVEFLLSDKAKWITGQQITVDGGRTIDITG